MTRTSHSTQTGVSDLSQDWHVKDFQPINYDYTGSPVNVTVVQGVQGVLFAAIGGSGGIPRRGACCRTSAVRAPMSVATHSSSRAMP